MDLRIDAGEYYDRAARKARDLRVQLKGLNDSLDEIRASRRDIVADYGRLENVPETTLRELAQSELETNKERARVMVALESANYVGD